MVDFNPAVNTVNYPTTSEHSSGNLGLNGGSLINRTGLNLNFNPENQRVNESRLPEINHRAENPINGSNLGISDPSDISSLSGLLSQLNTCCDMNSNIKSPISTGHLELHNKQVSHPLYGFVLSALSRVQHIKVYGKSYCSTLSIVILRWHKAVGYQLISAVPGTYQPLQLPVEMLFNLQHQQGKNRTHLQSFGCLYLGKHGFSGDWFAMQLNQIQSFGPDQMLYYASSIERQMGIEFLALAALDNNHSLSACKSVDISLHAPKIFSHELIAAPFDE